MAPGAQGWRWSDRRAERIRCRIALFQLAPPAGGSTSPIDDIDHAVQEFLLAGHVLVERHRDHSELLGQLAHAQGFDAGLVGQGYGGAQHAIPVKAGPARFLHRLSHLDRPSL